MKQIVASSRNRSSKYRDRLAASIKGRCKAVLDKSQYALALLWQRFDLLSFHISSWKARHGLAAIIAAFAFLGIGGFYLGSPLQPFLEPYFTQVDRLQALQSFFWLSGAHLLAPLQLHFRSYCLLSRLTSSECHLDYFEGSALIGAC